MTTTRPLLIVPGGGRIWPAFWSISAWTPERVVYIEPEGDDENTTRIRSFTSKKGVPLTVRDKVSAYDLNPTYQHSKRALEAGLDSPVVINVTSAPKPMAFGAYRAALESKREDVSVIYLDTARGRVISIHGEVPAVPATGATIDDYLSACGAQFLRCTPPNGPGAWLEQAVAEACNSLSVRGGGDLFEEVRPGCEFQALGAAGDVGAIRQVDVLALDAFGYVVCIESKTAANLANGGLRNAVRQLSTAAGQLGAPYVCKILVTDRNRSDVRRIHTAKSFLATENVQLLCGDEMSKLTDRIAELVRLARARVR